ncbi:hypothetical protein CAEBREN_03599 [Caenorhabditis brenneri]|uniref:Uncharacterized protein n=1 Tax=Caenorhabditis brenneri TaxID=135651 RepID=G0P2S8_CAEBE|nr:hypothetical protein CAEBREN_03599 [Caenorhabditis brenneri]
MDDIVEMLIEIDEDMEEIIWRDNTAHQSQERPKPMDDVEVFEKDVLIEIDKDIEEII